MPTWGDAYRLRLRDQHIAHLGNGHRETGASHDTACSNFSIAGKYTEWLLLGAAAVHYEGKLLWDADKGEITNNKDANQWVKPTFRTGWELNL